VTDHVAELAGVGEFGVEMGGVDVAGNGGEQMDVLGAQRAGQSRRVAHLDFVEGAILNERIGKVIHAVPCSSDDGAPERPRD